MHPSRRPLAYVRREFPKVGVHYLLRRPGGRITLRPEGTAAVSGAEPGGWGPEYSCRRDFFSDRAVPRSEGTAALHSDEMRGDICLCPISTRRLRTVVFNNPFGSFQDSVTAAKEEREQLDRLLTISSPRERMLVAVIVALSMFLAAWFFFGDVARNVTVDAVLVEHGNELPTKSSSIQALAWFAQGIESQVKVGLPAVVTLIDAGGEAASYGGQIGGISAARLSGQLAEFESLAPVSVHRVTVVLDKDLDVEFDAGTQSEIVIEVGRHSPIASLRMR